MPTVTKKYYHNIDLDNNQLINAVVENLATAPTGPVDGQIYYNTVDKKIYYYKDSTAGWIAIGSDVVYQVPITLTTTGSSGAATFNPGTGALNIPQYATGVTGSGTTNYVTKWATSTTLGVSVIYDNGSIVSIGTATPNTQSRLTLMASAVISKSIVLDSTWDYQTSFAMKNGNYSTEFNLGGASKSANEGGPGSLQISTYNATTFTFRYPVTFFASANVAFAGPSGAVPSDNGATVQVNGTIYAASLVGTGNRMVIALPTGVLSTQAIPSGNSGTVTSVGLSVPTGLSVANSPITSSGSLDITFTAGYSIPTTASQTSWDTAFTERRYWDGGATNLVAATGRTSLGATTVGSNVFTLINPSAITFIRINADNSVSTLDAATFRTAIGAGTSSNNGTVTSVAALTIGTTGTDLTSSVATGTTTPVITLNVPTASAANRGALSSTDWSTFNAKQAALSGTGFVKISGTTISYDNSTYLTGNQIITLSGDVSGTGSTAITTTLATITQSTGASFVKITLDTKGRVTGNTAVASGDITTALGFTPYNATNPAGYVSSAVLSGYLPLTGGTLTGVLNGTSAAFTGTLDIFSASFTGSARIIQQANAESRFLGGPQEYIKMGPDNSISLVTNEVNLSAPTVVFGGGVRWGPGSNFSFNNFVPAAATVGINFTTDFTNNGAGGVYEGSLVNSTAVVNTAIGAITFNHFRVLGSYNTTAGTTTARGFYYNPTITGSTGLTNIAFESTSGIIKVSTLSGSGTRMVVADSTGVLSTQAIPGGGSAYTVTSVSTTYSETATSGTKIIKANTTSGTFVITLPIAVGNTGTLIIKKTAGSAALTIDGEGTQTIDGGLTAVLNKVDESITLVSDNTNWLII